MTSNGVIDLILRFFFSPNSIDLQANYVRVVEDRPIMFAKYCPPLLATTNPSLQRGHAAIAELLVYVCVEQCNCDTV